MFYVKSVYWVVLWLFYSLDFGLLKMEIMCFREIEYEFILFSIVDVYQFLNFYGQIFILIVQVGMVIVVFF